ncbi:MAG: hypothetical protein K0U39_03020 [Alphaproteobacteria bacterium]|nr:hypothetical protein [Alphaproteobacteria bacterium]
MMANEIGGALGQQPRPQTEVRNDARNLRRNTDSPSAEQGSGRRNLQITDQVLVHNRPQLQNEQAAIDIKTDPRVQSLSGAINTTILLEGSLDDAAEIVEDLRTALGAGASDAISQLTDEFNQTFSNFTNLLQDGGRIGNNLLVSEVTRLTIEVGDSEPIVIEGRNILASAENGGIFEQDFLSVRGELDTEKVAQIIGSSSPFELAELPDNVLASLQSLLVSAQSNLQNFREDLTRNFNHLQQLLRSAESIQDTGVATAVIDEERANLLALQTRQQLENIGDGLLENRQEEILQFFR